MIGVERRGPVGELETRRFCEIYEESFIPGERDDTAVLLARVLSGERDCYLAVDAEHLLGLSVVLPLEGYPIAFLEYLAVATEARNAGIGGRIIACMRQGLADAAKSAAAGVLFEVDPPEDADRGSERELRRRRIAFYQRNGAVIVEGALNYHAPVMVGDGTLPYLLMWLPAVPGTSAPAGSYLKDCVTAIFVQSYELPEDTPLVRRLVAGLDISALGLR